MTTIAPGSPLYFAWLYSDARMQAVFGALSGIETEVRAALAPGLEHSVAHVRMTWWAEEAQRLRAGRALHPVSRALIAQWPPAEGAQAGPDVTGFVEDAAWDLARATFETRRELLLYCERWARAMFLVAIRAGAPELPAEAAQDLALRMGVAVCELDLLNSLQDAAHRGHLRLPLDELTAIGVAPETLAHAPWPEALSEPLAQRHRELRQALEVGCELLRAAPQRATLRGLLVWATLVEHNSRRAEAALPGSWRRGRWDGVRDAVRAWRTARRAMREQ